MANVATQQPTGLLLSEPTMFRNRIINGDMRIDQRNAGASFGPVSGSAFGIDRWRLIRAGGTSTFTTQQIASGLSGFPFAMRVTAGSGAVPAGTEERSVGQPIEGVNVADLAWGTVDAKTITISFRVRSSLTGLFGGAITNSAGNRSYVFSYTINAANTWEVNTVTIPGDTTGTWLTTTGTGISLMFDLGVGTTYSGAAGSWSGTYYEGLTGGVKLTTTSSATLDITGVQLEQGIVATPFEFRPFSVEVALCQRYYEKSYNIDVAPGTITSAGQFYSLAASDSAGSAGPIIFFKVAKRGTVTFTGYEAGTGASGTWLMTRSGASANLALVTGFIGQSGGLVYVATATPWVPVSVTGHWTASSEL
jgi:hypothetical protein